MWFIALLSLGITILSESRLPLKMKFRLAISNVFPFKGLGMSAASGY